MSRNGLLCCVMLLAAVVCAQADEPSFGFTGDFYRISPITLYGELPEDDVSVEAGETLEYYFYTTDSDSVQEYLLGEPKLNPVTLNDYTHYYGLLTVINSCQGASIDHDYGHEADDGDTNVWLLSGAAQGPTMTEANFEDTWYAQDGATAVWYPDEGTRDDAVAGPYTADVTKTPNTGWIYGTVYNPGGGGVSANALVKVYVGTTEVGSQNADGAGYYRFNYKAAGSYTVKAWNTMMKTGQNSATVTKGAGTLANVQLQM